GRALSSGPLRTHPMQRRCCATNASSTAAPRKPRAPVTTTVPALEPAPAMLAVEAATALHEPAHVREALARRVPAVMHDVHRRHVRGARDLVQAHAPVEVLEVQEEARV